MIIIPIDGESYKEYIDRIFNSRDNIKIENEYQELHHIRTRCLGGSDEENNLIYLYAQEHYYVHKLLALENPDESGLQFAWWNMCQCPGKRSSRDIVITADEFAEARKRAGHCSSEYMKNNRKGSNNPNYGKRFSEDHRHKIALSKIGKPRSLETHKKVSEHHANVGGANNPNRTKVKCIETEEVFETISLASQWCNINRNAINKFLSGKQKYAGRHPITRQKLHWEYVE